MIFKSPFPEVEIPELPITSFVLHQAAELGNKPALIDSLSGRTLTYGQLARGVRRIALGLAGRGLAKGNVLAIHSPNLPEYALAFHAVALLGGVVTPVSPLYTAEELSRQLEDSGAKYLLTVPPFIDKALAAARSTRIKNQIKEVFVFGKAKGATPFARLLWSFGRLPEVEIKPKEDVVVLPYSSGTSGRPKGVMLTHYNLVANLCQVQGAEGSEMRAAKDGRVLGLLPFFHIYGLGIMNYALHKGATVITMLRFDLEHFLETIQRYRINFVNAVPPLVLALARHPRVDAYDLSSLAVIASGAAPLSDEVAAACANRLRCWVGQGYGMTELSPLSHMNTDPPEMIDRGSVGPSVPNTEAKIVDLESGEALPPGRLGELCVRGPQLMKGYLNDPQATAAAIDAEGWLHTGDVAFADERGYVTISDRVKELIKYKGFQIAPAELEAVLLGHPEIADAAVVGSPDEEVGEVPKAFVVRRGNLSADDVIAYVAKRVAPYKKVRKVEFVEAIPRSLSGKILRRALLDENASAPLQL